MYLIRRSRVGAWAVLMAIGCLMALLALPMSAFAQEEVLYGCAGEYGEDSELYIIDPTTGAATLVGSMEGEIWCTGLAFSADGTLFAMAWDHPDDWVAALYTVNPNTGAATMVGHSPHSYAEEPPIPDISFRSDGTLFGYLHGDQADGLGTVNTATGAVTEIGGTGVYRRGNGIAFSPSDVLLHGNESELYTLDQTTGAAIKPVDLTFPDVYCPARRGARINAMDFNTAGTLYGSLNCGEDRSGPNYLVRVNTTTGNVSNIGPTVDGLDGIAFGQPPPVEEEFVPEWGSIALLGSGLAGLAGYASLRLGSGQALRWRNK